MGKQKGIGAKSRVLLTQILKGTNGGITVASAASILKMGRHETALLLGRWEKQGWLSRLKRGVYAPVPIESQNTEVGVSEPWVLAQTLFSPCYIGGWSAAEHWDLTEQIFHSTLVMTTRRLHQRALSLKGARFKVRSVKASFFFGLKPVWIANSKVEVTDPSRTILDLFFDPALGGGIRTCLDIFHAYMVSKEKKMDLLIEYGIRLGSGAAFKRLGFALDSLFPNEIASIEACRKQIKSGYSQLDPQVSSKRLVTSWNLWVPESLLKKKNDK